MLNRPATAYRCVFAVFTVALTIGCGGSSIKTHSVKGKVTLADGDIGKLAGGNIECQLESDFKVRPYGEILANGNFTLGMLHEGRQVSGAPEGKYLVRIVLADDTGDDEQPLKNLPIHPKFRDFKKSGLTLQVPTSGEVEIKVSRK
jgi:hypothetical protein